MAKKFEEILNSLPKERQEKIHKRTDELRKKLKENPRFIESEEKNQAYIIPGSWENEGGAPTRTYEEWLKEKIEKHYGEDDE